jgi:hypothetical protein
MFSAPRYSVPRPFPVGHNLWAVASRVYDVDMAVRVKGISPRHVEEQRPVVGFTSPGPKTEVGQRVTTGNPDPWRCALWLF